MFGLDRLLQLLGLAQEPTIRRYSLEHEFHLMVVELAQQEQRPESEVQEELLTAALDQSRRKQYLWEGWQSLTPREQEVTGLVCLGYTNSQIAAHLGISTETAKTHVQNVVNKFHIRTKSQLRLLLAEWDFSEWEKPPYR